MMNNIKQLSLLLIVIFCQCSSRTKQHEKIDYLVNGILVDTFSSQFSCPYGLKFTNDFVVILDACASEIIHVMDKKTLKLLKSFGTRGEGPEEFSFPRFTGQNTNGTNTIYLIDQSKRIINVIDLDLAVESDNNLTGKQITIPSPLGLVENVVILGDGKISGKTAIDGFGKAFFYNPEKDSIHWISYNPEVTFPYHPDQRHILYGLFLMELDNHQINLGMGYFRRIEIYNSKGILLRNTSLDQKPLIAEEFNSVNAPKESFRYYNHGAFEAGKMFWLNYGMSYKDYSNEAMVNTSVDVFTNEIEFLGTIRFDKRILYFDISPDLKTIYGISDMSNQGEYKIFSFDLSNLNW